VEISDATHFTTLADTLSEPATEGRLREMCDRWIYSTGLIFGLNREEQDRSGFRAQVLPLPLMPTDHIVSLLIAERDKLNRAIEALGAPLKRRGRPPKNPAPVATAVAVPAVAVPAEAPAAPKRRPRTAAQRKVQAERMKAYWARRRKEEKKG